MILSPELDYHLTAQRCELLHVRLHLTHCSWHCIGRGDRLSRFFADAHCECGGFTGHLSLDNSFAWLGTPAALTMLSVAAVAEILAYYIPVVDNLLDSLATPAAFIAGTIVSAAVMTDVPPMVKWTAAVIAGGGIAGLTQGATAALRAHSTVLTGGLGNPIIATMELGGALLVSFLALMVPAAALALVVLFLWLAIRLLRQVFPGVHSKNRTQ